jgi:hypothetical protein
VHDTDYIFALRHDRLKHRVARCDHVAYCFDGGGAKAGHVAYLAVDGITPQQRRVVDPHHDLSPGRAMTPAATRSCQFDQGVPGISLWSVPASLLAGSLEDFVCQGTQCCHHQGALFWSATGVQVERPVGAGVVAQ